LVVLDSRPSEYIGNVEMPVISQLLIPCCIAHSIRAVKEKDRAASCLSTCRRQGSCFNDIEQHKFEWKGKIVRVEVTQTFAIRTNGEFT